MLEDFYSDTDEDSEYHGLLEENNMSIRQFLKRMKDDVSGDELIFMDETRNTQQFLDSSISRVITYNIPLVPANTDLRTLLWEIKENHAKNFLIRKRKYVELITSEAVFEYIVNGYDTEDTVMDDLRRVRIPAMPRSTSIRDAFNLMMNRHIPLIMIEWTPEEKLKYSRIVKPVYPNVVTFFQICTMMSQRLIDDRLLPAATEANESDSDNDEAKSSLRFQHRVVEDEPSDNEEAQQQEEVEEVPLSFCQRLWKFLRFALQVLVYLVIKLSRSIVWHVIITILAGIDLMCCFLYIIDYFLYVSNVFFAVAGFGLLINFMMIMLQPNRPRAFVSFFEFFILLVNVVGYFFLQSFRDLPQLARAVLKTVIMIRMAYAYAFFASAKNDMSIVIRKWFNRNRNQKKEANLDMSNITKRIFAMSWPGTLWESVWRNSMDDVEDYLNSKYRGHYWVLNLCSESGYRGKQDEIFDGRHTRYWIDDHNPCSLQQILAIMYQSDKWLTKDPTNVIVIHCKGGKGRTGMIISCLLLQQGLADSPAEALRLFARMRTSPGESTSDDESSKKENVKIQRVSSPSQVRYVFYYNFALQHQMPTSVPVHLTRVEYSVACSLRELSIVKFELLIQRKVFPYEKGNEVQKFDLVTFKEETEEVLKLSEMQVDMKRQVVFLEFDPPLELCGDYKLTIQCTGAITDQTTFIWFNTNFILRQDTLFIEPEIDYSGRSFRYRRHQSEQINALENHCDPASQHGLSPSDRNTQKTQYGSFGSTKSLLSITQPEPVDTNQEYILLTFDDCHLSTSRDRDACVIRPACVVDSPNPFESKTGLRTIGETRKIMKDIVSGGTQILMATTEKVGKGLVSLVNGENLLNEAKERRVSSSSGSIVSNSVVSNSKRSHAYTEPLRHVEIHREDSDSSVVFEVIKNEDDSDTSS